MITSENHYLSQKEIQKNLIKKNFLNYNEKNILQMICKGFI